MNFSTFPIFLAFLCMGFGDAAGPFVGLAQDQFKLTNFEAQFIAFAGFIMFGLLSVPMGLVQDRIGKKKVLLIGLLLALIGLGIPALAGFSSYGVFLVTVLLLGAGAAILQVSGNPIMRDVSPEGKFARNLTLGQFIKAIGSLSASLIPFAAVKYFDSDWKVLFPIYSIALAVTIVIIFLTPVKEQKDPNTKPATIGSCLSLLFSPVVLLMVIAIFLYVGAEVAVSSSSPLLLKTVGVDKESAVLGSTVLFVAILTGRFLGSVVLSFMSAPLFYLITCIVSLVGLGLFFTNNVYLIWAAIAITGLGFANIFPLVFSLTIDHKPERANEISGLMVTAIVGGAFVPPLVGLVSDRTDSLVNGFLVPIACVAFLTVTALVAMGVAKKKKAA